MKKILIFYSRLILLSCLSVCFAGCANIANPIVRPYVRSIRDNADLRVLELPEGKLYVKIMRTWKQRRFAWLAEPNVKNNEAMLYVFDRGEKRKINPRYFEASFSFAFMDEDGKILAIEDLIESDKKTIPESSPSKYILQGAYGFLNTFNLKPGDTIDLHQLLDVTHCPHHALSLGLAFEQKDSLKDAVDCYEKVLKKYKNHVIALTNLANVEVKQGKIRNAKKHYLKALEIDSHYLPAAVNYSEIILKHNGNTETCQTLLLKAIESEKDYAAIEKACAFDALAKISAYEKDFQSAKTYFAQAIDCLPEQNCETKGIIERNIKEWIGTNNVISSEGIEL